jgi:hypothetical protein
VEFLVAEGQEPPEPPPRQRRTFEASSEGVGSSAKAVAEGEPGKDTAGLSAALLGQLASKKASGGTEAGPRFAPPTGNATDKKPLETRTLLVQLGPARSEVIVNGRRLGETPFAGQWTCADGDALRVQVIPRLGAPLERTLRCGGVSMLVGTPPAPIP